MVCGIPRNSPCSNRQGCLHHLLIMRSRSVPEATFKAVFGVRYSPDRIESADQYSFCLFDHDIVIHIACKPAGSGTLMGLLPI